MTSITHNHSSKPVNQKKRLRIVQAGAIVAAALPLMAQPAWYDEGVTHEVIELTGLSLIFLCVLGRLWSILYVGGRKNDELVTSGPYSLTRNPLYFFSTIGAVGIGLTFGSAILALALGSLTYLILHATARGEAAFLADRFGAAYASYAKRTSLFWPNPFRYRDLAEVNFSPRVLKRTFFDALYFLAVFPAVEFVEYLHTAHVFPTLISIY